MGFKPAHIIGLGGVGADEQKLVRGIAPNSEIANELALLVEHGRQREAPNSGDAIGHDVRQELRRSGPFHFDLAVIGGLDHADASAQRPTFRAHMFKRI